MVSFQAKIGRKMPRKRKNKKLSVRSFPTRLLTENSKKLVKKFKKLKYTIMASFPTKISWKRPRKRKNKNYRSVPFLHDA